MRVIILIDWGTCRNTLQVAEHLVGIGICLLLLTIIAIALNAIIGLVEPDRTAPVTLRIVLRIIGSYRREWDEGRELLLIVEQLSCLGKLLRRCYVRPERNIALTTCFTYKTSVGIQTAVVEEAIFLVKEIIGNQSTIVRQVERLAQQPGKFLEQGILQREISIQVNTLLICTPCILAVLQHLGAVETDGIIHTALPGSCLQRAINRTELTDMVLVMIPLLIPPLMIFQKLRIHLLYESQILGMLVNLVHRPGCQRRLTVAVVVLRSIRIDAVDNHAVWLLVVEHHADVILRQLREEGSHTGRETPAVPCPATYEIAYSMTRHDAVMIQGTSLGTPVGKQGDDGFRSHPVVFCWHIITYHLLQITVPALLVFIECNLRVGKQTGCMHMLNRSLGILLY